MVCLKNTAMCQQKAVRAHNNMMFIKKTCTLGDILTV